MPERYYCCLRLEFEDKIHTFYVPKLLSYLLCSGQKLMTKKGVVTKHEQLHSALPVRMVLLQMVIVNLIYQHACHSLHPKTLKKLNYSNNINFIKYAMHNNASNLIQCKAVTNQTKSDRNASKGIKSKLTILDFQQTLKVQSMALSQNFQVTIKRFIYILHQSYQNSELALTDVYSIFTAVKYIKDVPILIENIAKKEKKKKI